MCCVCTVRFVESIDMLGYADLFGSIAARETIWWIAYLFGFAGVCTLLYGWTVAISKSRELSMRTMWVVLVVVALVVLVFFVGVVLSIASYYRLSLDTIALIIEVFYMAVGLCVFGLAIAFIVSGTWLLVILRRTSMTASKQILIRKV